MQLAGPLFFLLMHRWAGPLLRCSWAGTLLFILFFCSCTVGLGFSFGGLSSFYFFYCAGGLNYVINFSFSATKKSLVNSHNSLVAIEAN